MPPMSKNIFYQEDNDNNMMKMAGPVSCNSSQEKCEVASLASTKTATTRSTSTRSSTTTLSSTTTTTTTTSDLDQPPHVRKHRKQRKQPQRRRVRFCDKVVINDTLHIDDFSKKEKLACWYTKQDFRDIRSEYRQLINVMQGQQYYNSFTCRGLENKTLQGATQRQYMVQHGMYAVMTEQFAQRKNGINNPEEIAKKYTQISISTHCMAFQRGLTDQNDVLQMMQYEIDCMLQQLQEDEDEEENEDEDENAP